MSLLLEIIGRGHLSPITLSLISNYLRIPVSESHWFLLQFPTTPPGAPSNTPLARSPDERRDMNIVPLEAKLASNAPLHSSANNESPLRLLSRSRLVGSQSPSTITKDTMMDSSALELFFQDPHTSQTHPVNPLLFPPFFYYLTRRRKKTRLQPIFHAAQPLSSTLSNR